MPEVGPNSLPVFLFILLMTECYLRGKMFGKRSFFSSWRIHLVYNKLGVIFIVLALISNTLTKKHKRSAGQTGCKQANRLAKLCKPLYLKVKPRVTSSKMLVIILHCTVFLWNEVKHRRFVNRNRCLYIIILPLALPLFQLSLANLRVDLKPVWWTDCFYLLQHYMSSSGWCPRGLWKVGQRFPSCRESCLHQGLDDICHPNYPDLALNRTVYSTVCGGCHHCSSSEQLFWVKILFTGYQNLQKSAFPVAQKALNSSHWCRGGGCFITGWDG